MEARTERVLNKLTQVLDDEIKVYRHLLDIVREEKEILIASKLNELVENNKSKEAMIIKVRNLGKLRERYARELAQEIGLNKDQPKLLELSQKLDPIHNERLTQIHTTLSLLIKRVKEYNFENEKLVCSALDVIQGAISDFKEGLREKNTYANKGGVAKKGVPSGAFLSKNG